MSKIILNIGSEKVNSSGVFFYTFRTNKFVDEIEEVTGQKVYTIHKPAQDFENLLLAIDRSGADRIFGIGMNKWVSRFEEKAFNVSGRGLVDKTSDLDEISLSMPVGTSGIVVSSRMTAGPCNYVAFRLASHYSDKKNYFLHLKEEDIDKLQAVAV